MQAGAWTRSRLAHGAMLAVGLALAAVVVPNAVSSAQEHPPGHEDPEGILPPGDWTPDQRDTLFQMVEDAEQHLPQFADPEDLPEGYIEFGDPHLGGYWHFVNWDMFDDGYLLDPNHPEALVYHREWDDELGGYGPFRLVSAMYILEPGMAGDNIPPDLAWLPGLHTHGDLCVDENFTFDGFSPCSPPSQAFDDPAMMHVWIEDPGCDPPHRFGGIDNGGLHCDVHGPHEPPGGTTTTTEHQHGSTTTTEHQHGSTTTEHQHGSSTTRPGHNHNDPPPATPIHRHPNTAG